MKKDPTKMPTSGLYGFGAAESVLKRCKDNDRRELLTTLARQSGLQGAPALGYLARVLRWFADEGPAPAAPEKLTPAEIRFCEERAKSTLEPYVKAGDSRLPSRIQGMSEVGRAA